MSEPVRQVTPNDRAGRAQPGPLRDWLATMKATTAAKTTITIRSAPEPMQDPIEEAAEEPFPGAMEIVAPEAATTAPEPEAEPEAETPPQMLRPEVSLPEPLPPQRPRLPAPQPAAKSMSRVELTRDISELMAENLVLKTKLRLENDRYESLQGMLAEELRVLRSDAESDMKILDAVCSERDQLKALTANAARKMHEMSARIESEVAQLAEMRSERDLWMARAEALALPLFQRR